MKMRKKILACLLALTVACTPAGVTWAAADTEGETVEVFAPQAEETTGEPVQEDIPEETELFQQQAMQQDGDSTGAAQLFSDEAQDLQMFTDEEENTVAFSSGEPTGGNELTLDQPIAVTGDENNDAVFSLKIEEEGIYRLDFSADISMDIHGQGAGDSNYGTNCYIQKLAQGSYQANCYEVTKETTISLRKLQDVDSLNVVSYAPDTIYSCENTDIDDVELEIIRSGSVIETLRLGEESTNGYGRISTSYYSGEPKYFFTLAGIRTRDVNLEVKSLTSEDPVSIQINSEDTAITPAYKGRYYFQITAEETGMYKIFSNNGPAMDHGVRMTVYESETGEQIIDKWVYGENTESNVNLKARTTYLVKLTGEEFTEGQNIKVRITRNPQIESIRLKSGKLDGQTFIRGLLEDRGYDSITENCVFEVRYADGSDPETLSLYGSYEDSLSKYYGPLMLGGLRDDTGELSTGDKNVWVGFYDCDVRSQEYGVHIVERPQTAQLTLDSEAQLLKGAHGMQWFSFRAPSDGTYFFQCQAQGNNIPNGSTYYYAKALGETGEFSWSNRWDLNNIELREGEVFYVGCDYEGAVKARVTKEHSIKKIKLADGEVFPEKFIKEFLRYDNDINPMFKVTFDDGESVKVRRNESIIKDETSGINYGYLDYEWPQNNKGEYVSGDLKVFVWDTYKENRDLKIPVTIVSADEAEDLPELEDTLELAVPSNANYNNGYCFVYEATDAGIVRFKFTPKAPGEYSVKILQGENFSNQGGYAGSEFVRTLTEGERIYFLYRGVEGSVSAEAAEGVKSITAAPTYTDIVYGDYFNFDGWNFQLKLEGDLDPINETSMYSEFGGYGPLDYRLDSGQNFDDGVKPGTTNVEFYLTNFPDITSGKIPIVIKKGSDMDFTKLPLNEEGVWSGSDNNKYGADKYGLTFIPEKDGVYQYRIANIPENRIFETRIISDEGKTSWVNVDLEVNEGTFTAKAKEGYTFLMQSYGTENPGDASLIITEIDRTKLQTLFDNNKNKTSSGYTSSSWNKFSYALDRAKTVLKDMEALQSEIDMAYDDLEAAIKGLTVIYYPPSVDKSSLRSLYNNCSAYKEAEYTASSWKKFQEAMNSAKSILDTSYSQSAVDTAEKNLKTAADALVKAADKAALKAAWEKYKAYKQDDYTKATWAEFDKALAAAQAGIADKDLTAETASILLDALEKAAAGLQQVGTSKIGSMKIQGNTVTAVLTDTVEKAEGYDFVIGTDIGCINSKKYVDIQKNILGTQATFKYVKKGIYYAYCHAWKRIDGKKVFGPWSEPYEFTVSAVTPATPKIQSVSVKGNTITITLNKVAGAISYDAVLGTKLGKDGTYGKRPVNYGNYVKKSKSNKIVFKNVKKGTYYFGVHAANRTASDGKKVFSKWSAVKKITIK